MNGGFLNFSINKQYSILVWANFTPVGEDIRVQVLTIDGNPTGPDLKIITQSFSPWSPDVTFVKDTIFQIVFRDLIDPFEHATVCLLTATPSTSFLAYIDGQVVNDDTISSYNSKICIIISNPDVNHSAILWEDNSTGEYRLYGRLYSSDGTPLSERFKIIEKKSYRRYFSADMDTSEGFVVVWPAKVDTCWHLYVR